MPSGLQAIESRLGLPAARPVRCIIRANSQAQEWRVGREREDQVSSFEGPEMIAFPRLLRCGEVGWLRATQPWAICGETCANCDSKSGGPKGVCGGVEA